MGCDAGAGGAAWGGGTAQPGTEDVLPTRVRGPLSPVTGKYKSAARAQTGGGGTGAGPCPSLPPPESGTGNTGGFRTQAAGDDRRGRAPCLRRTGVASVRKTEMPRWLAAFLWGKAEHMLLNGIWRHTV